MKFKYGNIMAYKKRKCFNCKEKKHIMLNYLEKAKIFAIINALNINNIKNIN